ncbi:MAG: hypothetical protein GH151_00145 [Bacteroidetes bacterium]|nr:hypothetical protein [Bacteroidota bacterium]
MSVGSGRKNLQDVIKPEVGIMIEKKIGEQISKGESLAVIHASDMDFFEQARNQILDAIVISGTRVASPPLFYETF